MLRSVATLLGPVLLGVLVALMPASLAGCASPSGSSSARTGDRLRVTLKDYKSGAYWELVSESHTDRLEYYSTERTGAARKVQTDEVMDALIDELDAQGYDDHAQDGRAPSAGGEVITRALEVDENGDVTHWIVGRGVAPEAWQRFNVCVNQFLQLYNLSASFQTVRNDRGHAFFDEAKTKTEKRR